MKKPIGIERRKLLGVATKGSSLIAAKAWVAPAILSVALPVHAQSSTTTVAPGNCAPSASSSATFPNQQIRPDVNRPLVIEQYDPQDGTISQITLEYDFTFFTDFFFRNFDTAGPIMAESSGIVQIFAPDGTLITTLNPSTMIAPNVPVTIVGGNRTEVDQVEANASGSIDLIAQGIDPSQFMGSGTVEFRFDAERTSTRVPPNDPSGTRVGSTVFFEGNINVVYACSL